MGQTAGASARPRVLVLDSNRQWHELVEGILRQEGLDSHFVKDVESWLHDEKAARVTHDVVIMDLKLTGVEGHEVLRNLSSKNPEIPIVVLSSYLGPAEVMRASKNGAFQFVGKDENPFTFAAALRLAVAQACAQKAAPRTPMPGPNELHGLLGRSSSIRRIFETIRLVAKDDVPVLIEGESGTGKERVARAISQSSGRKGPFVAINCAAIPADLLESELFGHDKGAFTGAHQRQIGHFERANGGTIFLDEIAEMSPTLQAKLLRVTDQQEIQPLGAATPVPIDTRILAATNQNLDLAVREGRFRDDLYHRLSTVKIYVPPLRERPADIMLLARHFLRLYGYSKNPPINDFTDEAIEAILVNPWPGNVRRLENAIKRAVLFTAGPYITPESLALPDAKAAKEQALLCHLRSLEEIEEDAILMTLEAAEGNMALTAKILRVDRTTLYRKLRQPAAR